MLLTKSTNRTCFGEIVLVRKILICVLCRLPWMSSQAVRIHSIHTYINDVLKHKDGLLGLDEANGSEPLHVSIKPSVVGESDVTGSLTSKTSLVLKGERDMIENKLTLKQYMNLSPCFIKSAQKPRTAFTADLRLPTASCSETLDESDPVQGSNILSEWQYLFDLLWRYLIGTPPPEESTTRYSYAQCAN